MQLKHLSCNLRLFGKMNDSKFKAIKNNIYFIGKNLPKSWGEKWKLWIDLGGFQLLKVRNIYIQFPSFYILLLVGSHKYRSLIKDFHFILGL